MTRPALTLVPPLPLEPARPVDPPVHLEPVIEPPRTAAPPRPAAEPVRTREPVYDQLSRLLVFLIDGQGWIPVGCGVALPYILYRLLYTGHGRLGLLGGLAALGIGGLVIVALGVYRSTSRECSRTAPARPSRKPARTRTAPAGRSGGSCGICGEATPDGANRAAVQAHEDAHARLLNKYGVGVALFGKQVWKNRRGFWQGYTMPASWTKFDKLPVVKQIAVYAAGVLAAPTTVSATDDSAIVSLSKNGSAAAGKALAKKDLRL